MRLTVLPAIMTVGYLALTLDKVSLGCVWAAWRLGYPVLGVLILTTTSPGPGLGQHRRWLKATHADGVLHIA